MRIRSLLGLCGFIQGSHSAPQSFLQVSKATEPFHKLLIHLLSLPQEKASDMWVDTFKKVCCGIVCSEPVGDKQKCLALWERVSNLQHACCDTYVAMDRQQRSLGSEIETLSLT